MKRKHFNRARVLFLCAFGVPALHLFSQNYPFLSSVETEDLSNQVEPRSFLNRFRARISKLGIPGYPGNEKTRNGTENGSALILPFGEGNIYGMNVTAFVTSEDDAFRQLPIANSSAIATTEVPLYAHVAKVVHQQPHTDNVTLQIPNVVSSGHDDPLCRDHFDFSMLNLWDQKAEFFCKPPIDGAFKDNIENTAFPRKYDFDQQGPGFLRCRVHVDDHLSKPSSPHTMCDGANVLLDLSQVAPTGCLKSRENYQCDGPPIWYQYAPGAFSSKCVRQPSLKPDQFPNDHLKDMFGSFQGERRKKNASIPINELAPVTLVVTRERGEHANVFHATSDFINMFFTLHVSGVISGLDGNRAGMERVQVLILDDQVGPFETLIKDVFSPSYPLLRITSLQSAGTRYLNMRHALFVPPGYSSIMLACNESRPYCPHGSGLLQSFRRFVLEGLGLPHAVPAEQRRTPADTIRVTFLSRRPYNCNNVEHQFMLRQIENEDQFMAALRAEPGVNVTRYDFACRSPRFQLEVMGRTDVLVAMHGAGMTNEIYLHRTAVIVELWPKLHGFKLWKCFKHIAHLMGLGYFRWINLDLAAFRPDALGDFTRVNITSFVVTYRQALVAYRDGLMR